jgi:hypothetical protein
MNMTADQGRVRVGVRGQLQLLGRGCELSPMELGAFSASIMQRCDDAECPRRHARRSAGSQPTTLHRYFPELPCRYRNMYPMRRYATDTVLVKYRENIVIKINKINTDTPSILLPPPLTPAFQAMEEPRGLARRADDRVLLLEC